MLIDATVIGRCLDHVRKRQPLVHNIIVSEAAALCFNGAPACAPLD